MSSQPTIVPDVCPKCHRSESWSVWVAQEGHPMGMCHRASCGYVSRFTGVPVLGVIKKKEAWHFTRPSVPLTGGQQELVARKFGIDGAELEGYSEFDDRFLLGVYGPTGYNYRGTIAYSLSGGTPKSLTYNEKPDEPFIHYAQGAYAPFGACRDLVIVEDWFSAEKVATTGLAIGVALNGTHLNQQMVSEIAVIAASRRGKVWLALDQDAHCKALGFLFKYREQFPGGLFCWTLRVDLKYETTARITSALVCGRTNFLKDENGTFANSSDAKGQAGV